MLAKSTALGILTFVASGFVTSHSAHAALSIGCADMKSDSSIDILLGAGPVPNFLSVTIVLGERRLTTVPDQPGEQVRIAQAYDNGEVVRVDLIDPQAEKKMAVIRIIRAESETDPLQIGYVQVEGSVPVGITCEGP
ncbi:MAG: hypothetical protein ACR2PF_15575 [Rhizobiaceae bacterium]